MLIFLIAVFLALQVADLVLTLRGLAMGKRERNPVALFFMRRLGRMPGLVFLKLAGIACIFLLTPQLSPRLQIIALFMLSLLGLAVVLHNMRIIRRVRKN